MESNGINRSGSDNNEIMDLTNQLIEAHEKIDKQNILIEELNKKLSNYNNIINNNTIIIKEKEEELNVNFLSEDQNIRYALPCNKNNIFAEIEEKLYQQFPEYRNTNNTFIANGTPILRFKTIGENNIGAGFPVILVAPS